MLFTFTAGRDHHCSLPGCIIRSVGGVNALLLQHLYDLFCIFLSLSEAFESDFLPGFHSQLYL